MNDELRQKLDEYCDLERWEPNDATIAEIITEGKSLKEYGHEEHRWFTMFSRVVQIGDIYVDFQDYSSSGDEPAFDTEEYRKMVLDSACEVFPKTVEIIDYVTETERVADKAHREKVEREVELYLCEVLKDESMAGLVMNLLVDNLLSHVTLNYREE